MISQSIQRNTAERVNIETRSGWLDIVDKNDKLYLDALLSDWSSAEGADVAALFELVADLSVGPIRLRIQGSASESEFAAILSSTIR